MLFDIFDKDEFLQEARDALRAVLVRFQPKIVEELSGTSVDLSILTQINALPGQLVDFNLDKGEFVFTPQGMVTVRWVDANLPKLQITQTFDREFEATADSALDAALENL